MSRKNTPTIATVRAVPTRALALRWHDGTEATIDLGPDIARLHTLRALRRAETFAAVAVGEGGHSVVWPGGLDIGADSLWRDTLIALGHADAVTLADWRLGHGFTLDKAAEALGLSRRMVAYYESGAKPVSKTVLLACAGYDAGARIAA